MKKYQLLLLFAALFGSNSLFGQTVNFGHFEYKIGCTQYLGIKVFIGSNPETGGLVTIQWGDGQTERVNYTTTPGQLEETFRQPHSYATSGNHVVTLSVYSATAGHQVGAPQTFSLFANGPANCGSIFLETAEIFPRVNYLGVTYDFTGHDGTTIQLTTNPTTNESLSGLNISNAPYTVSINDAWLASHGLIQVTPDFVITGFNMNGEAVPGVVAMEVDCATPPAYPDVAIVDGSAYGFSIDQTGNVSLHICNYACNKPAEATVFLEFPSGAGFAPNTTGLTNPIITNSPNYSVLTFKVPGVRNCADIIIPFTYTAGLPVGTQLTFKVTVTNPGDSNAANNKKTLTTTVNMHPEGLRSTFNQENIPAETISVSPNPANSTVRFNGAMVTSAQVYDLSGKLLISAATVDNNELSVSELSNGIYQVVMMTDNGYKHKS